MVDEILENIHLLGGDIVEGDGVVAAAANTLLLLIILVLPIPTVLGYMS